MIPLISAGFRQYRKIWKPSGAITVVSPRRRTNDCGHSLLAATAQERLQQQAEAIGVSGLSPDGTTVHTDYQRTHPSVRTNFGRQNLVTHPLHHQREHRLLGLSYGNIPMKGLSLENGRKHCRLFPCRGTGACHFNACISGVSALIAGKRMIENGIYRRVIVARWPSLPHFITSVSGLSGLSAPAHAVRMTRSRDDLNLGEGLRSRIAQFRRNRRTCYPFGRSQSATMPTTFRSFLHGRRTLFPAIRQAMQEAGQPLVIYRSFVNAHGTATVYNDKWNPKPSHWLIWNKCPSIVWSPISAIPLGASGIIESIVCMHELKQGILFGTPGYETPGVRVWYRSMPPTEHPDETLRKKPLRDSLAER